MQVGRVTGAGLPGGRSTACHWTSWSTQPGHPSVLVYQCVHGLAPAYLADTLQPVTGLPGRQRLRSSSTSALAVLLTPAGST